MKIVCAGNIAYDLIVSRTKAKNDFYLKERPGGSVLNTAIHLSILGLKVSLIAKTGKDFLDTSLLSTIKSYGIDSSMIEQDRRIKTGLAIAYLDKEGDSSYSFYKTVGPQTVIAERKLKVDFKKVFAFHTGSAYSYDDYTFSNALYLMERARNSGSLTSYDPNWRPGRVKDVKTATARIKKLISCASLLKLGASDATGITSSKTLSSALKKLPSGIIVTLGDKGSFFWTGKKKITCPSFKVKVVDTIGAGDAFTAGLITRYALLGKKDPKKTTKEDLVFASAVAAIVCMGQGATESLKSLRQVSRFLDKV